MPDKRQTSKQRRAARNRASREALTARRTNAVTSATTASSASSRAAGAARGSESSASRSAGAPPAHRSLLSALGPDRRPGDRAVLIGLVLALVSAVVVLFWPLVKVDDRGEPLPRMFSGVAITAREAVTGKALPDTHQTLLATYGGARLLLYIALPIAIAAFALWANARPDRSRLLTFAMLAMAGAVILAGGSFFLPSLVALGVASFQVRRADAPARAAETAARRRRGGVIDADSDEVVDDEVEDRGLHDELVDSDELVDDEAVDDEVEGGEVDRELHDAPDGGDADSGGHDPLAELEAELETEERARRAKGGNGPGA